ncbi:sigma-70 family RNA polymerase sigma factor [Sinomonas sp. JGH33]|uniref:Sigma-70 family RNA polymerase sigma factor n=1 Tax=Sinomonas terricola TaxID=3110330 RepID=A0ABU5T5J6_9MICC|nr:sigma-70 family RNA polymerase sigma factor [Sinomonas sp. JGH33]MEA5454868.1 sigma-70 family RNA polymerase sigma factor [Sinomonas sp. JGH33]
MRARTEADCAGPPDDSGAALLFSEAYRELAPVVRGYLRSHGVADPEAVTQDVFLALYPRIGSVTGGAEGLRTLVFTIAHARYVDYCRQRAKAPRMAEYDPAVDARTSASAEDEAFGSDSQEGILELLHGLSKDQREVITLRIVADLSLEQTAAVTGRSVGAVKQLQRRALLNLRNRLSLIERVAP